MIDQRKLIEKNEWTDLIVLDGCRFDSFDSEHIMYFDGKLTKVWNGAIAWTYDWFVRTFRKMYDDTILFSAVPMVIREKFAERGWKYPEHFLNVIGHEDIVYDYENIRKNIQNLNDAVINTEWDKRRVIRYLAPHPPYSNLPLRDGVKYNSRMIKEKLKSGEISVNDIKIGYRTKLTWAFEAIKELYPYLGEKIVITSDHGECLGDCGQLFHGQKYHRHEHLICVPYFEVVK